MTNDVLRHLGSDVFEGKIIIRYYGEVDGKQLYHIAGVIVDESETFDPEMAELRIGRITFGSGLKYRTRFVSGMSVIGMSVGELVKYAMNQFLYRLRFSGGVWKEQDRE